MKTVPGTFFVWQGVIAAAVVAGLALSYPGWRWDGVRTQIKRAYPELILLPAAELAKWLEKPDAERLVILDVRTRPEFDVSHLRDARWVSPEAQPADLEPPVAKDATIVVYCSVGNRSAVFARRLHDAGYTRVFQLDGSIFAWANEERRLVNATGATTVVHPQNDSWQSLLKKPWRAPGVEQVP